MAAHTFEDFKAHLGHDIKCVQYGPGGGNAMIAIECITCGCIILTINHGEFIHSAVPEKEQEERQMNVDKKFRTGMIQVIKVYEVDLDSTCDEDWYSKVCAMSTLDIEEKGKLRSSETDHPQLHG